MPLFRAEIHITEYHTIEEIDAEDEAEALNIAAFMIATGHDDVLFNDQETDEDYDIFRLRTD